MVLWSASAVSQGTCRVKAILCISGDMLIGFCLFRLNMMVLQLY